MTLHHYTHKTRPLDDFRRLQPMSREDEAFWRLLRKRAEQAKGNDTSSK